MSSLIEKKHSIQEKTWDKWVNFLKVKFQFITITDLVLQEKLIYCSYNLSFSTRMHHLPVIDQYKLPDLIISSFAFKYFPDYEKEFLLACKACNDTMKYSKMNPKNEMIKFSTGKEIMILIYNPKDRTKKMEFKIDDLSKFTGLCRRYKNPEEVEKMISEIFRIKN